MSKGNVCEFCGGADDSKSGTCEGCYHGMRYQPDKWLAHLARLGRSARHIGGCVFVGGAVICRDPYVPAQVGEVEP